MLQKMRNFCGSFLFSLIVFILAAVVVLVEGEVMGTMAFIMLISALLFLCDDITVTTLPFLLICLFVTKCYDCFDTFIAFAPWCVIPAAALLFHFIAYRRKFSVGSSFFGICAVAVAITAGGAFSISSKEYFSGTSLFYIAGLGIGMLALYLLMKSQFVEQETYNIRERLFAIFYMAGFFGVFMLFSHYAMNLDTILAAQRISIQWSNNLSTMMMFFMPIPFYYALTKHKLHILVGWLFYLTIAMTGSRGGLLMGSIEFILCLVFVAVYDKPLRLASLLIVLVTTLVILLERDLFVTFFSFSDTGSFISSKEPRYRLMLRALEDFKSNPLFGRGIGYTGNADCYKPVTGAANWYHMMVFQVIGSMGIVGILAYGYQFVDRLRLIFRKITPARLTLGLSYAGILLMSMVNPGEFCPVPYEMMTVLLFIFLELPDKSEATNAFLPSGLPRPSLKGRRKQSNDCGVEWYE